MKASRYLWPCAAAMLVWLNGTCLAAPLNPALESWIGHTQRDLFVAWGSPDQQYADGHGGKVLIYERVSGYFDPDSVIPDNDSRRLIVDGSQASRTTHHQVFYLDPSGKIYRWRRRQ